MIVMTNEYKTHRNYLSSEIASVAARMIAEEGATYEMAKKRAAKQIIGNKKIKGNLLPDNTEIEEEVRKYHSLFMSDTQPARLLHLRQIALQIMVELAQFRPYIIGAVFNGTAGEHSDIYLQVFAESAKDIEIYLLNKNVAISVTEAPTYKGKTPALETIHFYYSKELIHLTVYDLDDMRKMAKAADSQIEKTDIEGLKQLIAQQIASSS